MHAWEQDLHRELLVSIIVYWNDPRR